MKTKTLALGARTGLVILVGLGLLVTASDLGENLRSDDGIRDDLTETSNENRLLDENGNSEVECEIGDSTNEQGREQLMDKSFSGEALDESARAGEQQQERHGELTGSQGEKSPKDADQTREREQLKDGSCEEEQKADSVQRQERQRDQVENDGENAPKDADQTREREQLKDGSCEEEQKADSVQTQESQREQVKSGGENASEDADQIRDRDRDRDGSCTQEGSSSRNQGSK